MADKEDYFPRGGKKPTTTRFRQNENFLGVAPKGEKKKKRIKKKSEDDDGYLSDELHTEDDQSYKTCSIWLHYKVVKEGLLLLGRVYQVLETKVNISLPCRMNGVAMACHISEVYNKLLEAYVNDQTEKVTELSEMFRPGQYVAVKVLEVSNGKLMVSLMPQHINSNRTLADLHKGALIQAAVSSVEDHGYVMDIGIPNTRAFLPKDCTNSDIDLDVGMITWACVTSSQSVDTSVIKLSNQLTDLQKAFQRNTSNVLYPGTAFEFTVDKPLDNGIEGHIMAGTTAYIQRHQADTLKGKKPRLGQKIRARLLYAVPPNNIPFLTMKGIFNTSFPDLAEEQKFKEGDIIEEAKVLKITGRSIHLRLGEGSVGILSLRRVAIHEDLTDEQVLLKSYPIGSQHKVRVLCYNLSDYMYSVSDEASLLNEKYFSLSQLHVGDLVKGTISMVADKFLRVNIGRVSGYVPQTHMTESGIFVDPKKATNSMLSKKKFKVGQEVLTRVLLIDETKQQLTVSLKPTLLEEDLVVLKSYDEAEVGKMYTGVVAQSRNYILASFFNNVMAYIPRDLVSADPVGNLADAYHQGQIIKCTIIAVNPELKKMTASLTNTPFIPYKSRKASKRKAKDKEPDNATKKQKIEKSVETSSNENVPEIEDGKKKRKKVQKETNDADTESISNDNKTKKPKKKDKMNDEEPNVLKTKTKERKSKKKEVNDSESDAIETDIHEDSDQVLTPEDHDLIDLSTCISQKNYKRRVAALHKSIETITNKLNSLDKKIEDLEEKGLNAKNKKYHTSMHSEKLVIEERLKKIVETLTIAQEKLNQFDVKDKKKKKLKKDEIKDEKEEVKDEKNVNVVKILKPAIEIPSAKDFWSTKAEVEDAKREDSSSSEEEEEEKPKKKRKKLSVAEKAAKAREEEERIRELEKRAIESENAPRSSDQFERALLAEPNCSQLWIAYMAFHLQATEIDKARAVGKKALNTINFREEAEKLNVWLALLNLEHRFGTKESQQKTLEDALQMNDTFQVHSKLLDILVDTSKHQELVSLVELMMRKYRRESRVYMKCGEACFAASLVDKARYVMQKGIAALEKKEHVSLLVRFAQLERSRGDRERAEALFEQVLAVYPQRVDVCGAYVDMLLAAKDLERIRQVLERMTSQKLPARKMKVLFKKWIEIEEKIGDQQQAESIRQRALEFIDKAKF